MNVFDIIISVILLFGAVRGFIQGLFSAVASLVAVLAGVYFTIHYSYHLEYFLNDFNIKWSSQTNKIVAFAFTFLVVVFIIIFIGKVLTKLANISALGFLNKVLGALFTVFKSAMVLSIIFLFFDKFNKTIPFVDSKTLNDSVLYNSVRIIIPTLFPTIIDEDNPSLKFIEEF